MKGSTAQKALTHGQEGHLRWNRTAAVVRPRPTSSILVHPPDSRNKDDPSEIETHPEQMEPFDQAVRAWKQLLLLLLRDVRTEEDSSDFRPPEFDLCV